MYKLVSFICALVVALAAAAPSGVEVLAGESLLSAAYGPTVYRAAGPFVKSTVVAEPSHVEVYEPTLARLGEVVEQVPTAVSHQSSTVVHSKAARVAPLLTPAVRSYAAPAVRTYASPLIEHSVAGTVPLLRSLPADVGVGLGPAAAFVHANAPLQVRTYEAASAPLYRSYSYGYGTPVVYARNFKK